MMFFKPENEHSSTPTSSPQKDGEFDVVLYLLDYDGCLSHSGFARSGTQNTLLKNELLLDDMRHTEHLGSQEIIKLVGSGSARQSIKIDMDNAQRYGSGSSFIDIQQIADKIHAKFVPLLLSDIFSDLDKGTTLNRALNPNIDAPISALIPDTSKLTLHYAHMHSVAEEYPEKKICIEFYDDRQDILDDLIAFYRAYPEMIPQGVSVYFNHYNGFTLSKSGFLQGQGRLDVHYRQTVVDMIAVTAKEIYIGGSRTTHRNCTKQVTPTQLYQYRQNILKHAPHLTESTPHTATYKSDLLTKEWEKWVNSEKNFIEKSPIHQWSKKSADERPTLFVSLLKDYMQKCSFYGIQMLGYFDKELLLSHTSEAMMNFLNEPRLHTNAVFDYLKTKFLEAGISLEEILQMMAHDRPSPLLKN